jgi:hypothetical protein
MLKTENARGKEDLPSFATSTGDNIPGSGKVFLRHLNSRESFSRDDIYANANRASSQTFMESELLVWHRGQSENKRICVMGPNIKHQISNIKHQTSNIKHQTTMSQLVAKMSLTQIRI